MKYAQAGPRRPHAFDVMLEQTSQAIACLLAAYAVRNGTPVFPVRLGIATIERV